MNYSGKTLGELIWAKIHEQHPPRTKLEEAQHYAASVRARNPQMVVKRLTDRAAEREGVKA